MLTGETLGPYRVLEKLGEGGMGEVYRARDTKLDRDVAIKILPEAFAHDPERVARFQREAKVLASLNHPNIGGIYGLEEAPGVTALVLELVEGPTLADRIAHAGRVPRGAPGRDDVGRVPRPVRRSLGEGGSGPAEGPGLPIDDALAIARQMAEALDAAHEHGIIHRDLKPANIKVREDGTVKVLDFGLAKVLGPGERGSALDSLALTQSPTLSLAATQAGVILGTAAYMAPEQAKGKVADKRSDLWAFGCVLYEMLTGTRAFDGEDLTEVLGAVVRLEPDWDAVPPDVPLPVRTLLRTCLTKDPRKRKVEATTALFVLDNTTSLAGPAALDSARAGDAGHYVRGGAGSQGQDPAHVRSVRRRVALAGAAAVVVTGAIVGAAVWFATRPAPPRVLRTEVTTVGVRALSALGVDRNIAITPDGSRIVYRGTNQLLVRALDQLEPDVLSGLGEARGPFVSPDGQWVGFFDGTSVLKKVAITGGPPLTITPVETFGGARGATWGPQNTIVYATNAQTTGLLRVSAAGGDPTVLTKPDRERGEGDHLWPEFLPGGQAVLFTITAAVGGLDSAQIAVLDLASGASKVVVRGGHDAHYVSTGLGLPTRFGREGGHLVYGAGGTLRAVAFDRDRLEVVGTPVPVLEQVATSAQGGVDVAVATNGTMVYVPGGPVAGANRSLVWVDRMGREEPLVAPMRAYFYPRISPDGTRVALDIRDQQQDIWIWDFARETLTRVTFDPTSDGSPVWSPDSRRLLFTSARAGASNLFWQAADGTGAVERLTEGLNGQFPSAMTPDGSRVIFRETGRPDRLLLMPLQPPRRPQPLIQTMFVERNAEIAPDGRWLAYESTESGREEIYVRPFPDVSGGRWQVSTGGGRMPLWSRNGQELFYLSPDGALMGVRAEPGPSWRSSTPARILQGQYYYAAPGFGRTFDIAPDGRRFLMIKEGGGNEAAPQNLVVVQNWTEELKRLVPAN